MIATYRSGSKDTYLRFAANLLHDISAEQNGCRSRFEEENIQKRRGYAGYRGFPFWAIFPSMATGTPNTAGGCGLVTDSDST